MDESDGCLSCVGAISINCCDGTCDTCISLDSYDLIPIDVSSVSFAVLLLFVLFEAFVCSSERCGLACVSNPHLNKVSEKKKNGKLNNLKEMN